MTKRPTETKDSWKKLGMDLAALKTQTVYEFDMEGGWQKKYRAPTQYDGMKMYRRARALRKSSRRKGK